MLFSKKDYWLEENTEKREKIVSKVQKEHDPDRLVRIAMEAPIYGVGSAAIQKIQDYDQLLKIFNSRNSFVSEIAKALSDDLTRIRFLQEASFQYRASAEIMIESIQDKQLLYDAVCSGAHFDSPVTYAIVMLTKDLDILKKISINGDDELQMLAKKKLKDIRALEKIVRNEHKSIQTRFKAAKEIEDKYGVLEPKRELQKLGRPDQKYHILYPTVYEEWKRVEYICLKCGKIGGCEEDSESISYYGCRFQSEMCRGL